MFVGQTEARAGQAFCSSSLANDLHFALASIPLRETQKKFYLFFTLKNEENTKAERKKKGGDRGGKEDREGGGGGRGER